VPEITTPRIEAYIEGRLSEGAANGTINRELAALKRMLKLGAMQTPPIVNRVPYIPMLEENNVRKGFFEHGEFTALRSVLPSHMKGSVTFTYKTGWRLSEMRGLKWSHVDLDNGIVRIEPGEAKNKDGRTVYLDEELKEIFIQQSLFRKKYGTISAYVFSSEDGSGRINEFRKTWNTACRTVGIGYGYKITRKYVKDWEDKLSAGPTIHDFRRSAVRNMVRSGISERIAMKVSGHKTRSVFDRYDIVNDADLKLAAQKQEAYLQTQISTNTSTIHDFGEKNRSPKSGNLLK
jgi:integrase